MKVGCNTTVEKMEKATAIQRRDDSFMHCTKLHIIMIMFLFLCSQSSVGQTGQEQAGSHSRIAFCLYSEDRRCDELLT